MPSLLVRLPMQCLFLQLKRVSLKRNPSIPWRPASSRYSHSSRSAPPTQHYSTPQPSLVDHQRQLKAKVMALETHRLSKQQRPHPLKGQKAPGRGGCTPSLPTAHHRTALPALSALRHVLKKTPVMSMSLAGGTGCQLIRTCLILVFRLCLCLT